MFNYYISRYIVNRREYIYNNKLSSKINLHIINYIIVYNFLNVVINFNNVIQNFEAIYILYFRYII